MGENRNNSNGFRDPKSWFILAGASAVFLAFFAFEYWCGDFMSGKFHDARRNSRDLYEYGLSSWAENSMKSEMDKDKEYAMYALMATGLFLGIGFYFKNNKE